MPCRTELIVPHHFDSTPSGGKQNSYHTHYQDDYSTNDNEPQKKQEQVSKHEIHFNDIDDT